MRSEQIALFLLAAAGQVCQAQVPAAGNATERLAACQDFKLPVEYEEFLDVSFLGDRQYVEVGPVNFTYFLFGPLQEASDPRTPLFLIAGQGATSSVWTPDLLKGLAQERQVVIFDNRGIGLSEDSSTDPITIESYAESTVDLFSALLDEPPHVLGWSLGSIIALEIAVNYSSAMDKLVLADTLLSGTGFTGSAAEQQQAETLGPLISIVEAGSPLPPTIIFPDTEAGNYALCGFLTFNAAMPPDNPTQAQIVRQTPSLLDYFSPTSAAGNTIFDGLGGITSPTLVIVGQQDLVVSDAASITVAKTVPGATLVQYPDSGHAAILQHSVLNAALITAFLDNGTVPADPGLYTLGTAAQ